ncbi:hypothetical protein [Streptomyces sp. NPDC101455]|uniref:golvesin C-terminal-like domain-containing protein n=1 Tax=Streptomyces sp. NPDC101455 TaxID=3366142 RepID=UPI00382F226D
MTLASLFAATGVARAEGVAARPSASTPSPSASDSALGSNARVLGQNWRRSRDIALETSSDSSGYHLFIAHGSTAFRWKAVATLKPGNTDADAWTGYSCLTGDGRYVVSVVAPRDYTNVPVLRDRGGFAYAVKVSDGTVHPLAAGVAVKYYSPGCGTADTAVLTRNPGSDQERTQLISVDAAKGVVGTVWTLRGQVTSAVPAAEGSVLAARGNTLVSFPRAGAERVVGRARGQIYDIAAGADSTAVFLAADGAHADFMRMTAPGRIASTASGPRHTTELFPGRHGGAVLVSPRLTGTVPASVALVASRGLPALVDGASLDGQVVAGRTRGTAERSRTALTARETGLPLPAGASLPTAALATADLPRTVFPVNATKATTVTASAAHPSTVHALAAASATTPGCAIPRLSATMQVPQPGSQQVERAVDLAVTGQLLDQRPANYLHMGLVAYQPSADFPPLALGGGGSVPAQVYLGILSQESNLDQASWHALPGIAGDPLIADYYGAAGGVDTINYSAADCGYGIGQVTTGMDYGDTSVYSLHGQMKIAADYEENITAGLKILQAKWNQLYSAGVIANNGSTADIENWYMAVWAYNTGWHTADSAGNYGLGWTNNPANPDYPPGRLGFLRASYADAAHPGDWPYQERVFGWIEHPIQRFGSTAYATPTWNSGSQLQLPPVTQFCYPGVASWDNCNPGSAYTGSTTDPCGYSTLPRTDPLWDHCWWHGASTWTTTCATSCATQALSYLPGSADPGVTDPHPADCNSSLPASAVIVDTLADPSLNVAGCGSMNWTGQGTFGLSYSTDSSGNPTAAVDTHQIDVGFGGHIYFAHTQTYGEGGTRTVTGTWTPPSSTSGWTRVMVHLPDAGAITQQAPYTINTGSTSETRYLPTHLEQNTWVSLGVFDFVQGTGTTSRLSLSNITQDGTGTDDIAYDAAAFIPLPGKPANIVVQLGDSYSSGQGADEYLPGTAVGAGTTEWNACHRSAQSWIRDAELPGESSPLAYYADHLDNSLDYHSLACNGAKAAYMLDGTATWNQSGEFDEIPQLDAGYLDANTTLVTLTVGGNDAGFASTLESCILTQCPSDADEQANINATVWPIDTVLESIHRQAPNARIVLLGYPELFNTGVTNCVSELTHDQEVQMNAWADDLTIAQQSAVQIAQIGGTPVTYYSPSAEFDGHRLCDADEGINALVIAPVDPGDNQCDHITDCISMDSFHPNGVGTSRYALAFERALYAD